MEYEFTVVYKLGRTPVVANALLKLLGTIKPMWVPNQTIDVAMF
jgi:hypothetical protein